MTPLRTAARFALLLLVAGCSTDRKSGESAGTVGSGDSAAATGDSARAASVADTVTSKRDRIENPPVIRALYVNRFAVQSRKRLGELIAIADSTEINGLVLDAKDEFGLNYKSADPKLARNAGNSHGVVSDMKAVLDTLRAHNIYSIARVVVFKDPVAAALNPSWTIKSPEGAVWRDEKGNAWVNPYNKEVWAYNLGVAEELAKLGFDEIQFDYIRFPEPYKRLAKQVFPGGDGVAKPDNIANFLKEAKTRLNAHGVPSTADIFGLVTTVRGPLEVGQWWEKISPNVDVVLPMVYPSHYPKGSLGVAHPNAQPYEIVKKAIVAARERDEKLGIKTAEHVRPWIQAFSLYGVDYGPEQIRQQKKAIYEAGYDGWVWWHPGSKYEIFLPSLEKKLESRKAKFSSTAASAPGS
jgi:hypothetical protein